MAVFGPIIVVHGTVLDGGLTAQRPYVTQPAASDKLLQDARDEKWRVGLENI